MAPRRLLAFLAWLGVMGLGTVLNGFVLTVLWRWFVLPVFKGAPALTIPTAIGLSLVVGYLTYHEDSGNDDLSVGERFIYSLVITVVYPLVMLFFGWIVHLFL
jgi:hypothetical protein